MQTKQPLWSADEIADVLQKALAALEVAAPPEDLRESAFRAACQLAAQQEIVVPAPRGMLLPGHGLQ